MKPTTVIMDASFSIDGGSLSSEEINIVFGSTLKAFATAAHGCGLGYSWLGAVGCTTPARMNKRVERLQLNVTRPAVVEPIATFDGNDPDAPIQVMYGDRTAREHAIRQPRRETFAEMDARITADNRRDEIDEGIIPQSADVIERLLAALKLAECVYRKNCVSAGEPSYVLEAMQEAIAYAERGQPLQPPGESQT